jgi:hypothetical protein
MLWYKAVFVVVNFIVQYPVAAHSNLILLRAAVKQPAESPQ